MLSGIRTLVEWFNYETDWLYTKLYQNPIFFIDLWSFVHLWSGIVIFALIIYFNFKRKYLTLFISLFSYEVFEITIRYLALNVFLPETIKDQFTDIFIGMIGGYISHKFFIEKKYFENKPFLNRNNLIIIFTAASISFAWVGFYKYQYNFQILNSQGINYSAFLMWTAGIYSALRIFKFIDERLNEFYKSLFITWILYILCLIIFEYVAYHIVGGHEISKPDRKPLIFDIIHGTPVMHTVYLLMPVIGITAYSLLLKLFMNEKKEYSVEKINLELKNSLEI